MKSYTDIHRFGHKDTIDYFTKIASGGNNIRIFKKLDGANGQFEVEEDNNLFVYSRNTQLDESNNLRNFYQYVKNKVDPSRLPRGYKIFGEWLISHKVAYPQNMYNNFYIFDIFDSVSQNYIDPESKQYQNIVKYLVEECEMKEAEVIYYGPYIGMEHIETIFNEVIRRDIEFVGQVPNSEEEVFHEGIVIKSYDYKDIYGTQMFVKLVSERFKETNKIARPTGPDTSVERAIADFAATRARIEKTIYKLVDEGLLPEDFDLEHMQIIARNLPKRIYDDIMKEEYDTIVDQFPEFDEKLIGKKINSNVMNFAKEIIRENIEKRISQLR